MIFIVTILLLSENIIGIYNSGNMSASLLTLTKDAVEIYVWGFSFSQL